MWIAAKDGSSIKPKAPKSIFADTDAYTLTTPEGVRDLSRETFLSRLESSFATLRRQKIDPEVPMDREERSTLLMFTAAMMARTESQREHQGEQWGKTRDIMRKMQDAFKGKTPPPNFAPSDGPTFSVGDVERIAENPLQMTLFPNIRAFYQLLSNMDMGIYKTDSQPGFVTSDTPCSVYASELSGREPTIFDDPLNLPSTEIFSPLSSRHCAVFTRQGFNARASIPAQQAEIIN